MFLTSVLTADVVQCQYCHISYIILVFDRCSNLIRQNLKIAFEDMKLLWIILIVTVGLGSFAQARPRCAPGYFLVRNRCRSLNSRANYYGMNIGRLKYCQKGYINVNGQCRKLSRPRFSS
ncbi:hypothetical protein QE152_g32222 [Popillia japonica]|uniref:Secreted protein n=1 Tax=Popillia japonica TaxID=7064 RepID=A0AAW1J056_POPJA